MTTTPTATATATTTSRQRTDRHASLSVSRSYFLSYFLYSPTALCLPALLQCSLTPPVHFCSRPIRVSGQCPLLIEHRSSSPPACQQAAVESPPCILCTLPMKPPSRLLTIDVSPPLLAHPPPIARPPLHPVLHDRLGRLCIHHPLPSTQLYRLTRCLANFFLCALVLVFRPPIRADTTESRLLMLAVAAESSSSPILLLLFKNLRTAARLQCRSIITPAWS